MADYDNTNRGVLFVKNNRKNDKAPNYEGKLNVDGKEYELSGWVRPTSNGGTFLSLSIQEKDAWKTKNQDSKPAEKLKELEINDDSEIPF